MPHAKPEQLPPSQPCPLCKDLAQATCHFETWFWRGVRADAAKAIKEAEAESKNAERHLALIAERSPDVP